MSRIDLPSGSWIELGDPKAVTERFRRPIRSALMGLSVELRILLQDANADMDDYSPADMAIMGDINDLCAVALIVDSSIAPGRRCTVDDILDLAAADYDALVGAIGPRIGPLMSGVDFDPTPDPTSPTEPSSD